MPDKPDPSVAGSGVWRIADRLYLGDYRSGESALAGELRPVEPEGTVAPFAGVVSLCPMPLLPDEEIEGPALPATEWLKIPIFDGGRGETEFETALTVIRPFVWRRRTHGNVLVHCAAGMSRSVCVVAALLCDAGLSVEDALRHVAHRKAIALHHFSGDEDDLIAPAWEFRSCLSRLYRDGRSVRR